MHSCQLVYDWIKLEAIKMHQKAGIKILRKTMFISQINIRPSVIFSATT